mmetsp:Transcript_26958/g.59241  ORF Transcript_26958/g.59241 Transcript_26958/m.59241 type:complete len:108 (-) Transcript_26958:130-453(-)
MRFARLISFGSKSYCDVDDIKYIVGCSRQTNDVNVRTNISRKVLCIVKNLKKARWQGNGIMDMRVFLLRVFDDARCVDGDADADVDVDDADALLFVLTCARRRFLFS